jgi:hypothetical protein
MLDVFNSSAFDVVSLTDAIEKIPFTPRYLGEAGLFETKRVSTLTIAIEQKENQLIFLSPIPRGAPGQTVDKLKRTVRDLRLVHFQLDDAIMADEVQGIREFGRETVTQTVAGMVAERLANVHLPAHDATAELARIGAVKGIIVYANGSTLNLFTEFGVTQETEIDWDLDNATPASGALRSKCQALIRQMAGILGGTPFKYIEALCGDTFFDNLVSHPEVVASYQGSSEAAELRRSYVEGGGSNFGAFWFGGIKWTNYRGVDAAGSALVNTDKCHMYPVGVRGLFKSTFGPADYVETVNTMGRPIYVKQRKMHNEKGVELETQSNSLHICTRPKVLIPGRRT